MTLRLSHGIVGTHLSLGFSCGTLFALANADEGKHAHPEHQGDDGNADEIGHGNNGALTPWEYHRCRCCVTSSSPACWTTISSPHTWQTAACGPCTSNFLP